jgi:hypothetical protein
MLSYILQRFDMPNGAAADRDGPARRQTQEKKENGC